VVAISKPELFRYHMPPWKEGSVVTIPTTPEKTVIESQRKSHTPSHCGGSSHMLARVCTSQMFFCPLRSI